jgi:hypothetical protein
MALSISHVSPIALATAKKEEPKKKEVYHRFTNIPTDGAARCENLKKLLCKVIAVVFALAFVAAAFYAISTAVAISPLMFRVSILATAALLYPAYKILAAMNNTAAQYADNARIETEVKKTYDRIKDDPKILDTIKEARHLYDVRWVNRGRGWSEPDYTQNFSHQQIRTLSDADLKKLIPVYARYLVLSGEKRDLEQQLQKDYMHPRSSERYREGVDAAIAKRRLNGETISLREAVRIEARLEQVANGIRAKQPLAALKAAYCFAILLNPTATKTLSEIGTTASPESLGTQEERNLVHFYGSEEQQNALLDVFKFKSDAKPINFYALHSTPSMVHTPTAGMDTNDNNVEIRLVAARLLSGGLAPKK